MSTKEVQKALEVRANGLLSINEILDRIGFDIDVDFIEHLLGMDDANLGNQWEKQFNEKQFIDICDVLIRNIESVKSQYKK